MDKLYFLASDKNLKRIGFAVGAVAVVGVAAGVAVSSLGDNGLATVEKWIFSSQE